MMNLYRILSLSRFQVCERLVLLNRLYSSNLRVDELGRRVFHRRGSGSSIIQIDESYKPPEPGLNVGSPIKDGRYRGPENDHGFPLSDRPVFRYQNFESQKTSVAASKSITYYCLVCVALFGAVLGWPQRAIDWYNNLLTQNSATGNISFKSQEGHDFIRSVKAEVDASAHNKISLNISGKGAIDGEISSSGDDDENTESESNKKSSRVGFRDRKIIAYEDRIRAYSTPDKIFRYFATLMVGDEIFMTPEDFVRSITPGMKQPEGLGLDSFQKFDPRLDKMSLNLPTDSVFYHLGNKALISFSDYIFLLTVISTPRRQFEIAFRMFDLNGDGELDSEEFLVVQNVILDTTPVGKRHRDHATTGSTLSREINSALFTHFFSEDGDKKLSVNKFLEFQHLLQHEIMKLEFKRYQPVEGKIKEIDFADILLIYAGFTENKKKKIKKRVRQKFSEENAIGITFEEYVSFSQLLRCISDVDMALTFYHLAGAAIDQATLKHVAKSVAKVDLSDHLIDVVFTLFDENNDGHLSNREFIAVMKHRLLRGLDRPMDTGFVRFLNSLVKCGKEQISFKPSSHRTIESTSGAK